MLAPPQASCAKRLGITVSTTSGLVIKLVDRGLVTRGSLADDRRQAPLSLTEAGLALLGELSDEMHTYMSEVTARLGTDLDAITQALEILAEAASIERGEDTHHETRREAMSYVADVSTERRGLDRRFGRTFRALHLRDFRLFWLGQVVSNTGSWMQSIAQAWLVLELTDSPLALGTVTMLQALPGPAVRAVRGGDR